MEAMVLDKENAMPRANSSFLDKVLGRIGRLDAEGLQTVVQRLARERAFLEMLFNTIEDGVLVIDENGRVLYFNQAVTRILGWNPDAVEGKPIGRILPEIDWKQILAMDLRGGSRVVRHEFELAFPRPRFIRLYAAPLDGEARGSSGVALILHDATEARQKTMEAIEAERAHSLTLLAASVAHEIGNPLNALHIHLQLMGREIRKLRHSIIDVPEGGRGRKALRAVQEPDPAAAEIALRLEKYLAVAKGEITRLDYIITQFLQAIRPRPPQLQPASLNDVVLDAVQLLRPELENRGLLVNEQLESRLPAAPLDASQMKQVLVNLMKNAMQAMTKGGQLTLRTGQVSGGVWVSVQDNGGGIPQDQLNRIFEPFFTTKKKGTGLGLMIVQRIVREHSGRIELQSQVGEGTTFRVWLPIEERGPRLLQEHSHE
jgi:two-component system, sporulation sensor kinase E